MTARKTRTTFRLECSVTTDIRASAERVFSLLTNAPGFPGWNSTVTSIEGSIVAGQRLAIRVPSAPERTFKPTVTELVPGKSMTWSDGFAPMFKGVRTFSVADKGDGTVEFTMREVFSGLMLPMIAGSLPDFAPIFDQYAADLKKAAEAT